ncbi:MAG TPA: glycosyltransferase family 1 protein, partial [Pseudomonadota bacterium]|nr:glycosyltransferase family 1 protein [Pseudomonadota bacterium]
MVCSHAIQYLVPWFVHASGHPRLDLTVILGDEHGLRAGHDPEFDRAFRWDVDLATGYRRVILPNQAPRPGVGRFWVVASL